jgi:hypothetical protein
MSCLLFLINRLSQDTFLSQSSTLAGSGQQLSPTLHRGNDPRLDEIVPNLRGHLVKAGFPNSCSVAGITCSAIAAPPGTEIPSASGQVLAAPKLGATRRQYKDRNDAILAEYETGARSYQQIAEEFGLHFTTVGRIFRVFLT